MPKIVDIIDHFLIDLDGIVYIDSKLVKGSKSSLRKLRKLNKTIKFITNDPRKSTTQYVKKLNNLGIDARKDEVVTSSSAIAFHIKNNFSNLNYKTAYVIGSLNLKNEIKNLGITLLKGDDAKNASFVIFGGHPKFHYNEIKTACLAIMNGAKFFATSRDPSYPSEEGHLPATGALLSSVEIASNTKAIVAGKPEGPIFELALSEGKEFPMNRIAIIGDRLNTDILGGKKAGIKTILSLSGSTNKKELETSTIKPDFVIDDLRGLFMESIQFGG